MTTKLCKDCAFYFIKRKTNPLNIEKSYICKHPHSLVAIDYVNGNDSYLDCESMRSPSSIPLVIASNKKCGTEAALFKPKKS